MSRLNEVNKKQLLTMLYPTLELWVQNTYCDHQYKLPSLYWLCKHDIDFYYGVHLPLKASTVGQYSSNDMRISIAIGRPAFEVMCTMIHEITHAIQFYNLGARFIPEYQEQTTSVGYHNNPFEVQAKQAAAFLKSSYMRNRVLHLAACAFEWTIAPVTIKMKKWIKKEHRCYWTDKFPNWEYRGFWTTYKNRR